MWSTRVLLITTSRYVLSAGPFSSQPPSCHKFLTFHFAAWLFPHCYVMFPLSDTNSYQGPHWRTVALTLGNDDLSTGDSYNPLLDFNWRDTTSWRRETWRGPSSTRVLPPRSIILPSVHQARVVDSLLFPPPIENQQAVVALMASSRSCLPPPVVAVVSQPSPVASMVTRVKRQSSPSTPLSNPSSVRRRLF
jgi:hypothetical protein